MKRISIISLLLLAIIISLVSCSQTDTTIAPEQEIKKISKEDLVAAALLDVEQTTGKVFDKFVTSRTITSELEPSTYVYGMSSQFNLEPSSQEFLNININYDKIGALQPDSVVWFVTYWQGDKYISMDKNRKTKILVDNTHKTEPSRITPLEWCWDQCIAHEWVPGHWHEHKETTFETITESVAGTAACTLLGGVFAKGLCTWVVEVIVWQVWWIPGYNRCTDWRPECGPGYPPDRVFPKIIDLISTKN